ncbi:MAG TPA: dethiobiotin synthase [Chitinophagaceae bacterium]
MDTIFITGIGTGVGKTVVSAIITEALGAAYWKPIQAGYDGGTDSEWVRSVLSNPAATIFPEAYKLKLAASPHIAAGEEGVRIDLHVIKDQLTEIEAAHNSQLIIEGAGGLLVPLNEKEFIADLIHLLPVKLVLVSRNYLGSINHSLLTAEACRQYKLDVLGWVFNDQYMSYEDEIVHWSGYPKIASIPVVEKADAAFIAAQAALMKEALKKVL